MIISIIYFLFLQNENLGCPSKSVPDLGLNKDLLYLLSGPIQMTTLPFLVYTAILGFIIAFRGKKFGKNKKERKLQGKTRHLSEISLSGDFTCLDCRE